MAENIIITPGDGKIDFYDSGSTVTTLIAESGLLKFDRGLSTYLSFNNEFPNFNVISDLKISNVLQNDFGNLITSSGWVGDPLPAGAQGSVGSQGSIGAQGPTGGQGAQGGIGPQGSQGGTGPQGSQGSIGASPGGAQGAQGPTGGQGAQGGIGPQGSQGGTGPQGSQGAIGASPGGAQGAQGPTGGQGAQGGTGPQGSQGGTGPQGSQGSIGASPGGAQGAQGPTGGQGAQGGTGPQGSQGGTGPTGGQGAQGSAGATGPTGPPGPTGSTGAQGGAGSTGPQGAQGATGPSAISCYAHTVGEGGYVTQACSCCGLRSNNRCLTIYQQSATYSFTVNHYRTSASCLSSSCDWNGRSSLVARYPLGQYATMSFTCGVGSGVSSCSYIPNDDSTIYNVCGSDRRLKNGVKTLENSLENLLKIDAVQYDWNDKIGIEAYNDLKTRSKLHTVGLIAQNVRVYYPETVYLQENGYYTLDYKKLNAVLVEAIKEHQLLIDNLDQEIINLEEKLESWQTL